MVFGWSTDVVLKFSVLLLCPFPCPVTRESRLWLSFTGAFLSAPVGVCRLLALSASTLGCMKQKKTQGNHCCAVPQIQRFLIGLLSSLHLSESVCL